MSIATRHDNPPVNHHRENTLDASEETFDVFFHANCSKCYHMHKHVQLRVHKDPKIFTRFNCQNCNHRIAGIGRNETQSSFGSTETQPLEAGYGRPSGPSNLQCCINVDQPNGQSSGVEKAGSTVLSSPSESKRAEPGLSPPQELHTDDTEARSEARVRNDYSLREVSGPTTKSLSTIKVRLILKLEKGKIHLLEKSKNMKLFAFRFLKRNTPSPPTGGQTRVDPVPSNVHSDIRDFQPRPREGDRSVQAQDDHPSTPPPGSERRPSSVDQIQATARRDERLRQRRREATLRRNYFSRPVCHYEANCACVRRDSVGTGAGTDSPSTSRRPTLQETDDVYAGDLPPNLLHSIGDPRQLIYPRGPLDNNVLATLAETDTRPHARLSQATTIGSAGEA